MRKELFYNPLLLFERIGEACTRKMQSNKLKGKKIKQIVIVGQRDHINMLEYIKKKRKIDIIYDIGGNTGIFSMLANYIFKDAKIFAFEPMPEFQEEFLKKTSAIKQIILCKTGLGNENGSRNFKVAGDASSFLEQKDVIFKMYGVKKEEDKLVKISRLDDYVKEYDLPQPDLMKLDVEGFELEVLKGGIETIKKCRYFILEVSFAERHENQCLFSDIVTFLAQHNIHLFLFPLNTPLVKELTTLDLMFENRNLVSL